MAREGALVNIWSRAVSVLLLSSIVGVVVLGAPALATAAAPAGTTPATALAPRASANWRACNVHAAAEAPRVLWIEIKDATKGHRDIPASFWGNSIYRTDIARIICYESSFDKRATNSGHYGWFQMSRPNIAAAGVTFHQYWDGDLHGAIGWYQCTAGERYIRSRYGTPAAAWRHEADEGWY
jgi:hypothetical protein